MFWKSFLSVLVLITLVGTVGAKELRVLMIGNSFSQCVGSYLPQVVKSSGKHQIVLTSAYIGGCSLERHSRHLREAEKNPKIKPYTTRTFDTARGTVKTIKTNLNTLLKENQYDIITLQQNSANSWKFTSYEPYAAELIKYIRQYQKSAEIVIQQTWAYRVDSPLYKKWKFDQTQMYGKLNGAYRKFAEKYSFRVIPMADAVQIYRSETPKKYIPIDTKAVYKEPALPSFEGDVVGVSLWQTNRKTKKRYVHNDYTHLNDKGKYLQAVCWYAFLFNEDAEKVAFLPQSITAEEGALLRKCAQRAVKNYKQVK